MEDLASWSIRGGRTAATCIIPRGPVAACGEESWTKTWGSSVFGCLDSAEKNAACVTKSILSGDAAKPPPADAQSKPAAAKRVASGPILSDFILLPLLHGIVSIFLMPKSRFADLQPRQSITNQGSTSSSLFRCTSRGGYASGENFFKAQRVDGITARPFFGCGSRGQKMVSMWLDQCLRVFKASPSFSDRWVTLCPLESRQAPVSPEIPPFLYSPIPQFHQ